jgi:hypothetical protein
MIYLVNFLCRCQRENRVFASSILLPPGLRDHVAVAVAPCGKYSATYAALKAKRESDKKASSTVSNKREYSPRMSTVAAVGSMDSSLQSKDKEKEKEKGSQLQKARTSSLLAKTVERPLDSCFAAVVELEAQQVTCSCLL